MTSPRPSVDPADWRPDLLSTPLTTTRGPWGGPGTSTAARTTSASTTTPSGGPSGTRLMGGRHRRSRSTKHESFTTQDRNVFPITKLQYSKGEQVLDHPSVIFLWSVKLSQTIVIPSTVHADWEKLRDNEDEWKFFKNWKNTNVCEGNITAIWKF